MTVYDRSVDLQVRLEAAQAADASDELMSSGRHIVQALDRASDYLESVPAFRMNAGIGPTPDLDQKAAVHAVRAFRGGMSSHGPAAFQHQRAASLLDAAKAATDRMTRWVKARWTELFVDYQPLLDRERDGDLVGSSRQRMTAQIRAQKLRAAQLLDPISDREELKRVLGGPGIAAWLAGIHECGSELREAIRILDSERDALTPEVRRALDLAASDAGLPLADLSDGLLSGLRDAGVAVHLVVRRA